MKVLHYTKVLTAGGAGRMLRGLVRNLPHEAEVACEWEHVDLPMGRIPVHTQVGPKELAELLAQGGFDLLHWHFWTGMPAMQWLAECGPRIPQVLTLHVFSQALEYRLPEYAMQMVDRIGFASTRSHELSCYRHLPPEKARFVIDGAELDEALRLEPQPHSGFHVGRCGDLEPAKCPPDLIRIFDRVKIPGVRFTIAGRGSLLEPMRAEAARGDPDRYHLPGFLADVHPLLSTLDVYCYQLPGHSYAASELNVQEAMAAGLPVVLLPSHGCRDLVQDGVTGLLARGEDEVVDALERLYQEPGLRRQLGRNARDHAARLFGAHSAARGYDQLYSEALSRHSSACALPGPGRR